jgi:hypothetical protein
MGAQITRVPGALATKVCTVVPKISTIIIVAVPLHVKCVSIHMHRAESAR